LGDNNNKVMQLFISNTLFFLFYVYMFMVYVYALLITVIYVR